MDSLAGWEIFEGARTGAESYRLYQRLAELCEYSDELRASRGDGMDLRLRALAGKTTSPLIMETTHRQ